jgi:hypothetical protein
MKKARVLLHRKVLSLEEQLMQYNVFLRTGRALLRQARARWTGQPTQASALADIAEKVETVQSELRFHHTLKNAAMLHVYGRAAANQ